MFEDFAAFFARLDDDFFIELYDSDYGKIEEICLYLSLDLQLKRETEKKGDKRLADWRRGIIFTENKSYV